MTLQIIPKISRTAASLAWNILFPPQCVGCARYTSQGEHKYLCSRCQTSIPVARSITCAVCARRVVFGPHGGFASHSKCLSETGYMLAAASTYADPLVRIIIENLKYNGVRSLAAPLSEILISFLRSQHIPDLNSYCVVPVPLHDRRMRERGYNQARLLAETVAAAFSLELVGDALIRTRNTSAQARIKDTSQRIGNVAGCFAIKNASAVEGRNILLIDDVATTGATLSQAACVLRNAGCKRIISAVLAR